MAFGPMFCCGRGFGRKEGGKKQPTWRVFSLKELHAATNNFNYDNKLGEGGFGSVYWGQLWDGSQGWRGAKPFERRKNSSDFFDIHLKALPVTSIWST